MNAQARHENELLRDQRLQRGWSQARVAQQIGTIAALVSKWERGVSLPTPYYREKLCVLYGLPAQKLGLLPRAAGKTEDARPEELELRCRSMHEEGRDDSNAAEERETVLGVNIMSLDALRRRLLEYVLATGSVAPALSIQDVLDPEPWKRLSSLRDIDEGTLVRFEKITANCWQLLKFDGLAAVEQLLPTYLPQVPVCARQPSKYQERLARLASEGYILSGIVVELNLHPKESERECERAVSYARIAKDRNLEVAALKHLAVKYSRNNRPVKMLQTYQEALPLVSDVSPLLRGRTYLGLALAYAQNQQKGDAFSCLGRAHDTFPEHPEADPNFVSADCGTFSLYHHVGLIHMEFNQLEKARDTFAQVEDLSSKGVMPERERMEIINCQAEASLALRDLQSTRDLVEAGIVGAKELQSEKCYNDTLTLYRQMRLLWPDEQQVKDLADLFRR
jgi:transcriptional regulator with XRE-family HTH domain